MLGADTWTNLRSTVLREKLDPRATYTQYHLSSILEKMGDSQGLGLQTGPKETLWKGEQVPYADAGGGGVTSLCAFVKTCRTIY